MYCIMIGYDLTCSGHNHKHIESYTHFCIVIFQVFTIFFDLLTESPCIPLAPFGPGRPCSPFKETN